MKQVIYTKNKFTVYEADLNDKSIFTKVDTGYEGMTCGTNGMFVEEHYSINDYPHLYLHVHTYAVDEVYYYLLVHGVCVYCADLYGLKSAINDYQEYNK